MPPSCKSPLGFDRGLEPLHQLEEQVCLPKDNGPTHLSVYKGPRGIWYKNLDNEGTSKYVNRVFMDRFEFIFSQKVI